MLIASFGLFCRWAFCSFIPLAFNPLSLLSSNQNHSYEKQVVLLISILAELRIILGLLVDLTRTEIRIGEIATDASALVLFAALIMVSIKANFKSVHPAYGFVLILVLGLNFLEFGGVHGNSRFNYYAGFFIMILLYSGRPLFFLLFFQSLLIIGLTIYVSTAPFGETIFFIGSDQGVSDFLFILAAMGILSFYLKNEYMLVALASRFASCISGWVLAVGPSLALYIPATTRGSRAADQLTKRASTSRRSSYPLLLALAWYRLSIISL